MPFSNPDFPNQVFSTVEELREAQRLRRQVEEDISNRSEEVTRVTATIIPAPQNLLEQKVADLEKLVQSLQQKLDTQEEEDQEPLNPDNLPIGMVLQGESKGHRYTLEVLADGYLCSTGHIEPTLSAAAERVSGNRRSGWKFWKDFYGNPIGEATGRFKKHAAASPFADPMS